MWISRRWQSVRRWLGRRSWWSKLLLGAALFTSPCWCGCGGLLIRGQYIHWFVFTAEDRAFFHTRTEYREGVPSVARRLKAEMEPIQDPDIAIQQHPDWAAFRLPNGEWLFGHGVNSHGFRVGHGTLVVKDSRGQVRIFFGHVCGSNQFLEEWYSSRYQSLDDFYKQFKEPSTLREWVPDP